MDNCSATDAAVFERKHAPRGKHIRNEVALLRARAALTGGGECGTLGES